MSANLSSSLGANLSANLSTGDRQPGASRPPASASRRAIMAPALAALFSVAWACWLYGWRVVDPRSTDWLLHGDPAQHYAGLTLFLAQPWHWPPGTIMLSGAEPSSVVFTDSIPLLALVAKAAGFPAGAQYFGLWILCCHGLIAGFAAILLRRFGAGAASAVVGSLFFATAPALLMRAYGHEALMGQFFVVAALALASGAWSLPRWALLLAAAVLVHPYLAAMVFALAGAALAAALRRRSVTPAGSARGALLLPGAALIAAWCGGYFVGDADRSGAGFGYYSANALTWFDPMDWDAFLRFHGRDPAAGAEWSALLPPLGQATQGQYEGFAYLGAGLVFLALAVAASGALRAVSRRRGRTLRIGVRQAAGPPGERLLPTSADTAGAAAAPAVPWVWLWSSCAIMALLALSTRPSVGAYIVPDWSPGETASRLAGVFRASGRFVWPLTFLFIGWIIARAARLRAGFALLCAAALVQAVDLMPKNLELRARFRTGPPGIQAAPDMRQWSRVLRGCPRVQWLDDPLADDRWVVPVVAAARTGARPVDMPLARRPASVAAGQARLREALRDGKGWRDDTVYVALRSGAQPTAVPAGFQRIWIGDYAVLAAPRCLQDAGERRYPESL